MGRATWFDADGRKRGEWTEEEDRKLVAYIDQYGIGDWRFIPHKAGLMRCGKSCRLRWFNYLRPGIDKSKFTPQEEQTIINFHSILGNRWAAIAQEMSNRSDNDIKNHWNCCLKKRLERNGIDPITHKPFIKTPSFYSQPATSSSSTPSPSSSTSFSGSARLLNKIAASVSFRNNDVDKIKNILSVSRITNQEVEEEEEEEEEEKTIVNDIGQEEDDFLMWDEKRTKRFVEEIIELMEFETTSYDSIDFTSLQHDSYDENGLLDEIMHDLF